MLIFTALGIMAVFLFLLYLTIGAVVGVWATFALFDGKCKWTLALVFAILAGLWYGFFTLIPLNINFG